MISGQEEAKQKQELFAFPSPFLLFLASVCLCRKEARSVDAGHRFNSAELRAVTKLDFKQRWERPKKATQVPDVPRGSCCTACFRSRRAA